MKPPEWLPISCGDCKHFHRAQWGTCAAYPDGIPLLIASGEIAHTTPQLGDHGIQFEPRMKGWNSQKLICESYCKRSAGHL